MSKLNIAALHVSDCILPEDEDEIKKLLGDYRAKAVLRHKTAKGRALSFCAGMALKEVLSERSIDITRERFCFCDNEKPMLRDRPNDFFNISHSGELALAASYGSPVGCDIQQIADKTVLHLKKLSERFFTENESHLLDRLSGDEDMYRTAFYLVFSAKESFIKCTGEGLKRPLSSFEVPVPFAEAGIGTQGCRLLTTNDGEYSLDYYFPDDVIKLLPGNLPDGKYVAAICNKKG